MRGLVINSTKSEPLKIELRVLFISLFIILSPRLLNAQDNNYYLQVVYNTSNNSDDKFLNIHDDEMILLINDSSSIYVHPKKIRKDSLLNTSTLNLTNLDYSLNNYKTKVISIRNKDNLIKLRQHGFTLTQVNSNFDKNSWKISNKTKEILGYPCLMASINYKGRKYTAYFTDEISNQSGPYIFYGLPGLILKITDSENLFVWEATSISKINSNYHPRLRHESKVILNDSNYLNKVMLIELEQIEKNITNEKQKSMVRSKILNKYNSYNSIDVNTD